MPLTLRPPRPGKSPNYEIRGTYLRIRVEQSAGTGEEKIARQELNRIKRQIERGEFPGQNPEDPKDKIVTFAMAAEAYLLAGGEAQYLAPILKLAGDHAIRHMAISDIDQVAIDNAAAAIYPGAPATTTNRQVYTPISAVLKRAGNERKIKRPKGWRGSKSKSSLEPGQAFALLTAAEAVDCEFGLLCTTLLYTGMRISEALNARLGHLNLDRATLHLPQTKNGEARMQHLPPVVVAKFRSMRPRPVRLTTASAKRILRSGEAGRQKTDAGVAFLKRGGAAKLFRFHQGGHLRDLLKAAMQKAGLSFPRRQGGFHLFCHTYGTWMARYGKLDNYGLTRTKRWKDPRSAEVYVHMLVNAEARQADVLPVATGVKNHGKIGQTPKRRTR